MKKIIRFIFIGVAAAILLLVVTTAIFVAVFDANAYKQDLSDLVREQTGRELEFHGDVSLTIFPALGMKLGAMSFSNAPGFGAQPMIKVKEVSISVDLASLIAFSPEVDKLVMRDLEVNLVNNKAGVTNWDDLMPKSGPETAVAATPSTSKQAEAPAESAPMQIQGAFGGLDLDNIKLSWVDQQAGSEIRVNKLDISTGRIVLNESFPVHVYLDASGSETFNVNLDFKSDVLLVLDKEQLTLQNLVLAMNEFVISGQLGVSNFSKPALKYNLSSKNLDVDAVLGKTLVAGPEAAADNPAVATTTAAAEDVQIALPMELLRELDIDGQFKIEKLKVQNLSISEFSMPLKARNGIVAIDPMTMQLYNGDAKVTVSIDANGKLPKYSVSKTLQDVKIGGLLHDFAQLDIISGALNADISATTQGEWLSELKKNSNGQMKLAFLDGALKGFNLRHSIESAKAKLKKQPPPPKSEQKTDFSALTISGMIRNGVFSSEDLNLQAPLLRVGGKGSADLNDMTVDYLVKAKLVGTTEGQDSGGADQFKGLTIPVSIRGPFAAPKIDVQLDELLKGQVDAEKEKLKAEIAKQKEALQQQIAAEKKALEESKKRELQMQKEAEEARLAAEIERKKEEAKQKLLKKLGN